jgi:hypothetical protein
VSAERIEFAFPRLKETAYHITSPRTTAYNCVAWAAHDDGSWWGTQEFDYWPANVPREYTVEAYTAAFATLGYALCEDGSREDGFEKIAIFVDERGEPQHVARQQSSGVWTSKLGKWEDIDHELLGLEGDRYGRAHLFMKRKVNP